MKFDLSGYSKKVAAIRNAPEQVAQILAQSFLVLVQAEFPQQADPYAIPWKPLKTPRARDVKAAAKKVRQGKTPRGGKILLFTGALRKSFGKARVGRAAWSIFGGEPYAVFHQYGTKNMVARPLLPTADRGVPDRYNWAFQAAMRSYIKSIK